MQDFENGNLNIPPSFGEGENMFSQFDYQAPGPIDNLVPVNLDTSVPSIPAIPTSSGIYDAGYDANNPFDFFTKTQKTGATEEEMAFQASKPYSFASGYKQTNFERYYNDSDNFYKLGFNPIANNEENYNANRTWYQDAWRGFSHIPHLGASFIKSGYRSLGDMFSGDFSFTDETGADEFAEIMAKYGSTKGGVAGFTSNLVLQSGIVAGIAADYIATEAALAGITALSEGVALPGAITAATAKTVQLGKRIADLRKIASANTAREVYNTVRTAKLANIVDGGVAAIGQGVKNLVPSTATNVANLIKGNAQITDLAQVTRGVGDFIRDIKQISYTTSEASLEGGQVKNDFIDKRIQEFINEKGYYPEQEDLNKIYEKAEDAGFTTGMINAPLIYLTNGITFDNLFKGGKNALVKSTDNLIAQGSKTGRKLIIDPVTGEARITAGLAENTKLALKGFVKPKQYLDFTRRYFAANLSEGIQETSQEIISGASTDYFERLYKTPEAGGIAVYLTDAYENLKDQASAQGIETFLSGFLMGGLSGIAGTIGSGAKRSVVQQYYERKDPEKYTKLFDEETERFNQIAKEINEAIQQGNKILTPDFENLLVQIRAGADMVEALKSFDDKAFHDIKDAARFNAIYTSLETGKFNFLLKKLEDMKQMTGAELKEAFELSDDVTEEEAKKVLDVAIARASQIKSQYDQFSEYKNPFNPNKYTFESIKDEETYKQFLTQRVGYRGFEDARKVAVFSLHNVELVSKRLQDLSNNITEISNLGEVAFSDVLPLLSPTDLQNEIDILSQEIKAAKGVTDQALKDQTEKKKKKLKSLQQFKKHFATIENIEDKTEIEKKRWLKDAFVKYMNELAEANNKTFIKADLEKAYTYFVDYLALNKDLGRFTEAVNTLTDPIGFYAEANRRIKARETFEEKRNDYMKEAFQEFLSDAKTNELINYLDDNNFIIDKTTIPSDLPKGYEAFKTFLLNDPDVKFIDQKTQRSFTKTDPRFKTVEDLINKFDELIKPKETITSEVKETKEVIEEAPVEEEIISTINLPVINNNIDFNKLPTKLKAILTTANANYNSEMNNQGDEITRPFQFANTARGKKLISDFFNNPDNAADVQAYNEKTKKAEEPTASVPLTITSQVRQQLYDLGYTKQDVDAMKPETAQDIIAKQTTKSKEPTTRDAKSDIEKTLYGTIAGSIPLSQALPNGVYIDLDNGLFAYADKNEEIAAIVDKNNNYLVSKSFWNATKNAWQLPNKANLEDDAKKLGVDKVTYIKKYQDAVDSLNAKYNAELAALETEQTSAIPTTTDAKADIEKYGVDYATAKLLGQKLELLEKGKAYLRVIYDNQTSEVRSVEIVTGTGDLYNYTFTSGFTGAGSTKSSTTKLDSFVDSKGELVSNVSPETRGEIYEIPNINIKDKKQVADLLINSNYLNNQSVFSKVGIKDQEGDTFTLKYYDLNFNVKEARLIKPFGKNRAEFIKKFIQEEYDKELAALEGTDTETTVDETKIKTIRPELIGKVIYVTPASGKTPASEISNDIVDGDNLLFNEVRNFSEYYDITIDQLPGVLAEISQNPEQADSVYNNALASAQKLAGEGKTVVFGSRRLMPEVDIVITSAPTEENNKRIIKKFTDAGQQKQSAEKSLLNIRTSENKIKNKIVINEPFEEYIFGDIKTTSPEDIVSYEKLKEKLDEARSFDDLRMLEINFTAQGFINDVDLAIEFDNLINNKRKQLKENLIFESVKIGDILLMKDGTKNNLVKEVTGKYILAFKPNGTMVTILKENFNKEVDMIYNHQAQNEDEKIIGVQPVEKPSSEEVNNINKNLEEYTEFTGNPDVISAASKEADSQSTEDVNNEFLNDLGC